ncbi:MAG: fumarylacetoacetate hydrolase family protein [bacterium]|jgi:2-keto-4-pentenoate hydratase/2-oxohepta-3-ene-1,7-dioic acid hydratase in catechol pathway|nr:fumarylacetoacetate hydrolase family protein [bacterium]
MHCVNFDNQNVVPGKIVCVGMNYVEHIRELKGRDPEELVLFMKPNSAVSEDLVLPAAASRYEGELSFIMRDGRPAGIGFGLDLTLSQVQKRLKGKGLPWEKSKAFDRSAIFSRFIPFTENFRDLALELWINGELRQNGSVDLMLHKPSAILKEIARHFTLDDNDIVMTGTPKGVGTFARGNVFTGKLFRQKKLLLEQTWTVK